MLETRLLQSGALPSGKITLANTLSPDLIGEGAADEEDEEEDGERRDKAGLRRGKMGIRNGFASGSRDADEWD